VSLDGQYITPEGGAFCGDVAALECAPGADPNGGGPSIVHRNRSKLDQVASLPIAAFSAGANHSPPMVLEDFGKTLTTREPIEAIASRWAETIAKPWADFLTTDAAQKRSEIVFTGYGGGCRTPESFVVRAGANGVEPPVRLNYGPYLTGFDEPMIRLMGGFAGELPATLSKHLPQAQAEAVLNAFGQRELAEWCGRYMPLGDAVEFLAWAADVTIGYQRFRYGQPTVLGPVDLAIITYAGGFQWLRRKVPTAPPPREPVSIPTPASQKPSAGPPSYGLLVDGKPIATGRR
jgi:hypothetical protein